MKRLDVTPMIAGHILTTPMELCRLCCQTIDESAPLIWIEDGFIFWKFSDGAVATRIDAGRGDLVLVDLPDDTTYRPGQSSWPPALRPHGPKL